MIEAVSDKSRCEWPGSDPIYVAYHDEEWGVPEYDPRALWEKLILDGFQAGLSWITILRKREAFRVAFVDFDPVKIAAFTEDDVERLLGDAGIIRSRAKIVATIGNARAYLAMQEKGEDFADFLWSFVGGAPIEHKPEGRGDVPVSSPESEAMSKALKARGFKFVGPGDRLRLHAGGGMINDHYTSCFRHEEVRRITKT